MNISSIGPAASTPPLKPAGKVKAVQKVESRKPPTAEAMEEDNGQTYDSEMSGVQKENIKGAIISLYA